MEFAAAAYNCKRTHRTRTYAELRGADRKTRDVLLYIVSRTHGATVDAGRHQYTQRIATSIISGCAFSCWAIEQLNNIHDPQNKLYRDASSHHASRNEIRATYKALYGHWA